MKADGAVYFSAMVAYLVHDRAEDFVFVERQSASERRRIRQPELRSWTVERPVHRQWFDRSGGIALDV